MKKNKMVTMHLIALLLLLVGLAVTTASTYIMVSNYQRGKTYTEAKAIVVEHENKKNGLKAIIVEYNVENKYYKVKSKHYTKKPESIGSEIRIKYDSKKPEDFIWIDNNHTHKYLISGLILLVGDGLIWLVLKSWLALNLAGKKKVDVSTPAEPEPKKDKPADVELPAPKKKDEVKETEEPKVEEKKEEVAETDSNIPLFEKEATPAIFAPLTEEEKANVEKEKAKKAEAKKAEEVKKEIPLLEEELELPVAHKKEKEESKKAVIPEIPYDLDSPREAIVSNVMETTIAIPTINKELIDLPTPKKETKNVKINNNIKSDALTKLLEDIEKGKK